MVFEHDGVTDPSECLADLLMLFNAGEDDLDHLLSVVQESWNYFPHRSLGGRCPAEVMINVAVPRKTRRRNSTKRRQFK